MTRSPQVFKELSALADKVALSEPRQSPITDIKTLTRMVLESYEASYIHSSPKVRRRYRRLICALSGLDEPGEGD